MNKLLYSLVTFILFSMGFGDLDHMFKDNIARFWRNEPVFNGLMRLEDFGHEYKYFREMRL